MYMDVAAKILKGYFWAFWWVFEIVNPGIFNGSEMKKIHVFSFLGRTRIALNYDYQS